MENAELLGVVAALQKLSTADGNSTGKGSAGISCELSTQEVEHCQALAADERLGKQLWPCLQAHDVSFVGVKRCAFHAQTCDCLTGLGIVAQQRVHHTM